MRESIFLLILFMNSKNNSLIFRKWISDNSFYSDSNLKNEKKITSEAERRTLEIFRAASKRVPAYKHFLKKNKINASKITTMKDFKKVPTITKKNYIDKYNTKMRCWDGKLDTMHMLSTSSGTSGEPYFWPRDLLSEIEGAYFYEFMYRYTCNITRRKTLFINGFAMGTWIAGTFTLACTNLVAWKGYSITTTTPGYDAEPIIQILKLLTPDFDQVIITGFVPFLKELAERALAEGIHLKNTPIILLGTGQGITENWRSYVQSLLNPNKTKNSIFNIYGSADASIMAVETPLSVALRKQISDNHDLKRNIFHKDRLPSLYNFDPRLTYFEEVDNQLHVTKNSGCPLIRYNMLDEGGVYQNSEMLSFFNDKNANAFLSHRLPFVYLFGRDKFMVKIYGANIYTEHVQQALNHSDLQQLITGKYIMEMANDKYENPLLICRIELNFGIKRAKPIVDKIQSIFIEEVRKINSEYNYVLIRMGDKVKPQILLYEKDHPTYFPKGKVKKTT